MEIKIINKHDVQVFVILSGAKDHDFRFFSLRLQNDDDRKNSHTTSAVSFQSFDLKTAD